MSTEMFSLCVVCFTVLFVPIVPPIGFVSFFLYSQYEEYRKKKAPIFPQARIVEILPNNVVRCTYYKPPRPGNYQPPSGFFTQAVAGDSSCTVGECIWLLPARVSEDRSRYAKKIVRSPVSYQLFYRELSKMLN